MEPFNVVDERGRVVLKDATFKAAVRRASRCGLLTVWEAPITGARGRCVVRLSDPSPDSWPAALVRDVIKAGPRGIVAGVRGGAP